MPIIFLFSLLAAVFAAAVAAMTLVQLVALSDLEIDQTNAHDATRSYNSVERPRQFAETLLVIVAVANRNWPLSVAAAVSAAVSVASGSGKIESVDVHRMLKEAKTRVVKRTVVTMLLFTWTLWILVRVIIGSIVSTHGQAAAAAVLREAAASLH